MKLLHVDASPKLEWSNSRALSRHFVELLQAGRDDIELDYLDLCEHTPAHVSREFAIATYTPEAERTAAMRAVLAESDALCRRLLDADLLVFAMPMYNWSMPSNFKAYVDNIVRGGLTYVATADGRYVGQLARHKVLFVTSRGADLGPGSPFAHMDALTPALRAAFGFIGVAEPQFVDAQPMQFADPEARAAGLARARTALAAVAADWLRTLPAPRGEAA